MERTLQTVKQSLWTSPYEDQLLKIISYNIQFGLGQDDRYDLARIADEVRSADIVALQEVERHWHRSDMMDEPALLGELLPDHYWVYGANLDLDASTRDDGGRLINRRRQFGNMVMSRFPIISSRNFPLPKYGSVKQHSIQRGILETVIDPGSGPVRIYSVHLCHFNPETRLAQVHAMKDIFARAPSEGGAWCGGHPDPSSGWLEGDMPPMPREMILLGDMNFSHESGEYAALVGPLTPHFGRTNNIDGLMDAWVVAGHEEDSGATWPGGPRIDHCFISSNLRHRVRRAWINEAAKGSDHWPLWVEFDA